MCSLYPAPVLKVLDIQDATITNSGTGDLIYHANDSTLTLDNLTLDQTGTGDAVVFASTTAQIQTFSGISISGSVASGALIALPSTSAEIVTISNSTFTNTTGAGNVISWASGTNLTIDTGATLSNTGTGNAISVEGGSGNLNVTGVLGTLVTVNANDGFALTTDGTDFGAIDIEYVQSNAPFDFELTDASATSGSVSFTNNTLDLSSNPPPANQEGAKAVLSFVATYGDLTISDLDTNTITVTDPSDTISGDLYGIYTAVDNTNTPTITFTNSIQDNNVTLEDISANMTTYGLYFHDLSGSAHTSANIILADNLDNNTILIDNKYGAQAFYNSANLSITNDIINNNWTIEDTTESTLSSATNYGFLNTGDLAVTNVYSNTIIIQNHAGDSNAFSNISTDANLSVSGNFGASGLANDIESLTPTTADDVRAFYNTGTVTIDGDLNWNTFVSTATTTLGAGDGRAFNTLKNLTVHGDIAHNAFTATGIRALPWDGNVTNAPFRHRQVITSNMVN